MKYIFLFIIIVLSFNGVAFAKNVEAEDNWPINCAEAAQYIISSLDKENLNRIEIIRYRGINVLHEEWSKGIENYMGLWDGNDRLIVSCMKISKNREPTPSNTALTIIEEAWRLVHEEELKNKDAKNRIKAAKKARITKLIAEERKRDEQKKNEVEDKEAEKKQQEKDAWDMIRKKEDLDTKIKDGKQEKEKGLNDLFNQYNRQNVR